MQLTRSSGEAEPLGDDERTAVSAPAGESPAAQDAPTLRLSELERDLRAFCHDLRSPLVALQGFARLLEADHAETLGDEGRHFVSRVLEASRRIEWRLHDFDALMQLAAQTHTRTRIDPGREFARLGAELRPILERTGAQIHWPEDPPEVYGDAAQLRAVLIELTRNALQFGAVPGPLEIRVGLRADADAWELIVADDGPGMDERQCERAFDAFRSWGERQRLDDGRAG